MEKPPKKDWFYTEYHSTDNTGCMVNKIICGSCADTKLQPCTEPVPIICLKCEAERARLEFKSLRRFKYLNL